MKKILVLSFLFSISTLFAQQHFFYGLQLDYGPFGRTYDQNRDILKGTNIGRMMNLRLSTSYRVFDQLTAEVGMSLNGMKLKLSDQDFKERYPGFESLIITQNRFMSFYGSLKYSYDLGRKRYLFLRTGYEISLIGGGQRSDSRRFEQGNEFVEVIQTYGNNNSAITPEIGYEFFNNAGNLITLGLKYHRRFSGDDLLSAVYRTTNGSDPERIDRYTVSGSYMALTAQFNGLLSYTPKKERVKKEKIKTVPDLQEPVLVEAPPVDTTKPILVDNKQANNREYAITNKIKVSSEKVKIYVWDHQIEDGDRINLILNDQWILTDYTLKSQKHMVEVTLKPGTNNLILYALNLGKYKPNTAAIMVDDGVKKQQVILESTLDESSALEIKLDK